MNGWNDNVSICFEPVKCNSKIMLISCQQLYLPSEMLAHDLEYGQEESRWVSAQNCVM